MPADHRRGRASLVGGVAVGVAVLVIWGLLAHDLAPRRPLVILPGVLLAVGVAVWIRAADL
jgi:hypothetical protein